MNKIENKIEYVLSIDFDFGPQYISLCAMNILTGDIQELIYKESFYTHSDILDTVKYFVDKYPKSKIVFNNMNSLVTNSLFELEYENKLVHLNDDSILNRNVYGLTYSSKNKSKITITEDQQRNLELCIGMANYVSSRATGKIL